MNGQYRIFRVVLLVTVTILSMVACNGNSGAEQAAEPALETIETSFQAGWIANMEYSWFFVAEEAGYFADEALAVEFRGGGFDDEGHYIDPLSLVTSGQVDFGAVDSNALLVAREKGAPVVAIGAIYQRNPVAFVSFADKGITQPQDLVGTRLAIDLETATGVSYLALLASQGIDPAQINQVPRTSFDNDQLINGEVDVLDAFVTTQPVQLKQAGYEINIILAADYGIEMYPNVIFTTEERVANNPDLVTRFLRAAVRGMQSASDDPQKAVDLVVAYNDNLNPDFEIESMHRSLPLLNPTGSRPGMMQAEVWQVAHQILLDQGILSAPLDLEAAYRLDFLEQVYANDAADAPNE